MAQPNMRAGYFGLQVSRKSTRPRKRGISRGNPSQRAICSCSTLRLRNRSVSKFHRQCRRWPTRWSNEACHFRCWLIADMPTSPMMSASGGRADMAHVYPVPQPARTPRSPRITRLPSGPRIERRFENSRDFPGVHGARDLRGLGAPKAPCGPLHVRCWGYS